MTRIPLPFYGPASRMVEVMIEEYFNGEKTVFIIKTAEPVNESYVESIAWAFVQFADIKKAKQFSTYDEAQAKIENCFWTSLKEGEKENV